MGHGTQKVATSRSPRRRHGIFCLEGDWHADLRRSSSVEPLLHLLQQGEYGVPYVHRNASTPEALEYYLAKWTQRRYDDHPILYLPFHGSCGGQLHLDDTAAAIDLDWLEERLPGLCKGRMIFIASCDTLGIHGHRLNRFLRRTEALAVCGYRSYVGWLESAALDLLVLGSFQENALTRAGVRAMRNRIARDSAGLARAMRFHMVIGG